MTCKSYSFEQCVEIHGLQIDTNDSELLCGIKEQKVVEYISFATFAIVVYVLSEFKRSTMDNDEVNAA